jgi:hypothetical protein
MNGLSGIGSADQAALQLGAYVIIGKGQYPSFRNDHDVLSGWKPEFVQSEKLAQKAFDPISLYRVPCFFTDRHAQSSDSRWIPARDNCETLRIAPNPLLVNP